MPEIQEEEIDLREYINVLLKRKGIIILIFLWKPMYLLISFIQLNWQWIYCSGHVIG